MGIRAHLVDHDGSAECHTRSGTIQYQKVRKGGSWRIVVEQWCDTDKIYATREGTRERWKNSPYGLVHAPSARNCQDPVVTPVFEFLKKSVRDAETH